MLYLHSSCYNYFHLEPDSNDKMLNIAYNQITDLCKRILISVSDTRIVNVASKSPEANGSRVAILEWRYNTLVDQGHCNVLSSPFIG